MVVGSRASRLLQGPLSGTRPGRRPSPAVGLRRSRRPSRRCPSRPVLYCTRTVHDVCSNYNIFVQHFHICSVICFSVNTGFTRIISLKMLCVHFLDKMAFANTIRKSVLYAVIVHEHWVQGSRDLDDLTGRACRFRHAHLTCSHRGHPSAKPSAIDGRNSQYPLHPVQESRLPPFRGDRGCGHPPP